ncbi:hypothetical protein GJAV_G00247590 [Gymnothorax javanicus]|nr:hypothetical protein GJAV_G00247590 [Gymnothorax javanicus]
MGRRDELLKPIWHAFTALDVDKRGKVSKSQLKVLSHNLCTVLRVAHDPVALEEHFKDNEEGPVSTQGYMPYLNRFILDKVRDFDRLEFNKMCWTLCAPKNLNSSHLLITDEDAFKVWCVFNFLSEDRYPLVIIIEEIEYFLRRLTEAMGGSWEEERFQSYRTQQSSRQQQGLSAWEFIQLVGTGQFCKGMQRQTLAMGIREVFLELVLDVIKQGYLMKKGHKRKNWTERWFVLRQGSLTYYVGEDLSEKKGSVSLDGSSCVESLEDKDGRKCLFIIRCPEKTFEISASDKKKKQEWMQAIQTCIHALRQGLSPPHRAARQQRREQRRKLQAEQEQLQAGMRQLQVANELKQQELQAMRRKLQDAAASAALEERRRMQTQQELQERFCADLEREKLVRIQMEQEVAQKSSELEQYLQRVKELEDMYRRLEEALEDERQARQDEENMRRLQGRLLEEEACKRVELEHLHMEQRRAMSQTVVEKQELEKERMEKERALRAAMFQLEELEQERRGALQQYEEVAKKLEKATNKTKSWKDKVAHHEGLIRLIEPGAKEPQKMTNWGPAAFTETELNLRVRAWQEKKNKPPRPDKPL